MSRLKGSEHENTALQYLLSKGLQLVERNYQTRRGEIDLVLLDRQTLVFVEVRYRKSDLYGGAAESVTLGKQQRVILAAEQFLQQNKQHRNRSCRFDVIAIGGIDGQKIDWINHAFQIT